MAAAPAASVEFGPKQMPLSLELLRLLTAGDTARLEEMLSSHGQTNGHVAINVAQAAAAPAALAPSLPGPTTSCFLLGVTSNGNTALHLVASRGHEELAALLCDKAPSLVATRNRGLDTPLHCAAKAGHREVAACLLSTMRAGGAEEAEALRAKNCLGATALYEAVRHGHGEMVELLMAEAPQLASVTTDDGLSPLYLAATTDSPQIVRALLRSSQDGTPSPASFSGPEGRTALHAATFFKEMVQDILSWKPELLTRVDSSGRTPLHIAAQYHEIDAVKLFLESPISLELAHISDNDGLFPLHIAAMVGSKTIIEALIEICPDFPELVDGQGRNLLHCAVEHNQDTVVRYICQKDKSAMLLNATDVEGYTPLHLAVKYGHLRIASLLLQTMAVDTDITDMHGLTARDLSYKKLKPAFNYFLDPNNTIFSSLDDSRATTTLDGFHAAHGGNDNPIEEPASENEDLRTIASVLIATVAFAAAFTVPGGFVADDHPSAGTAILAKRFAFKAFIVSDTIAFLCSIVATSFLIYGGSREIPRNHQREYNVLASGLVPVAVQFLIAAFAFGLHLVMGEANLGLIIFVYLVSVPSVLFCFPGIWVPLYLGLGKAIWRRAGWRGLTDTYSESNLGQNFCRFIHSFLFKSIRRPLFAILICATFIVAIALQIALPNY
ncbi:hypothetical protein EJB05_12169, partial [Eragrostis curvula]